MMTPHPSDHVVVLSTAPNAPTAALPVLRALLPNLGQASRHSPSASPTTTTTAAVYHSLSLCNRYASTTVAVQVVAVPAQPSAHGDGAGDGQGFMAVREGVAGARAALLLAADGLEADACMTAWLEARDAAHPDAAALLVVGAVDPHVPSDAARLRRVCAHYGVEYVDDSDNDSDDAHFDGDGDGSVDSAGDTRTRRPDRGGGEGGGDARRLRALSRRVNDALQCAPWTTSVGTATRSDSRSRICVSGGVGRSLTLDSENAGCEGNIDDDRDDHDDSGRSDADHDYQVLQNMALGFLAKREASPVDGSSLSDGLLHALVHGELGDDLNEGDGELKAK